MLCFCSTSYVLTFLCLYFTRRTQYWSLTPTTSSTTRPFNLNIKVPMKRKVLENEGASTRPAKKVQVLRMRTRVLQVEATEDINHTVQRTGLMQERKRSRRMQRSKLEKEPRASKVVFFC